jgi:ADP-ribose pyrophosphatase YjhB (NUDIX family)
MYKVFYNDRMVVIAHRVPEACKNTPVIPADQIPDLNRFAHDLFGPAQPQCQVITTPDAKGLFSQFKGSFKEVKAAGGLVRNQHGEILMIKRNNRWDLPKGKAKKNETREENAIREVKEECGIHELTIGRFITDTYHTYIEHNQHILKKTSWFEMFTGQKGMFAPQLDEGITEVVWFGKKEIRLVRSKTYKTIAEVIDMSL